MGRAIKLLKYYPLETKGNFSKILINNNMKDVLNFVRKKIIIGSKLLVFGYYAYDYYKYKATNEESPLYVPYYDVISTDLKTFSNDIEVKEYHPFFQFLDSRISFE